MKRSILYWLMLAALLSSFAAFSQVTPEKYWKIDQVYGVKAPGSMLEVDEKFRYVFAPRDSVFSEIGDSLGVSNFLDSVAFETTADSTINEFYFYSGSGTFGPFAVKTKETVTTIFQSGDTLFFTNENGVVQTYLPDLSGGGGSGGTVEWDSLLNVPAGFADGVDNVDDADNDPTNELYDDTEVFDSIGVHRIEINDLQTNVDSCCGANGIDSVYFDPDFGSPGESVIIINYVNGSQDIFNVDPIYDAGKITAINFVNDSTVQFVQNSGSNNTAISWNISGFENIIKKYAHENPYGEAYIISDDPDTITFASGSTNPLQVTETTADILKDISHSAGTLTYNGTDTIIAKVQYSMSFNFTEGTDIYVWVFQNGSAVDKSEFKRTIQNPNDEDNAGGSIFVELAPDDTIEIHMAPGTHTGDDDLIIDNFNFNVIRVD